MSKTKNYEKILQVAELLFSKNGFNGVTTKEIANKANITEMTLFNHFPNKELLYKTVVKEKYLKINISDNLNKLEYKDLEYDLKIISLLILRSYKENRNILLMRLKEKDNFNNDINFKLEDDPILNQIKTVFEKYEELNVLNTTAHKALKIYIISLKGICHISILENLQYEEMTTLIYDFVTIFSQGIKK